MSPKAKRSPIVLGRWPEGMRPRPKKRVPLPPAFNGVAAVTLVTALLQALRDRGVLSRDDLHEVLADAAENLDGSAKGGIGYVRDRLLEGDREGEE